MKNLIMGLAAVIILIAATLPKQESYPDAVDRLAAEREAVLMYHNAEICWDDGPLDELPRKSEPSLYQLGMWHLKYTEGLRLEPYKCAAGVKTIGWGHAIRKGEKFSTITVEQANEILLNDFNRYFNSVHKTYPHIKEGHRVWALAMFAYNMRGGLRAIKGSRLEYYILKSDWEAAANQLLKWNKAYNPSTGRYRALGGLTKKRKFEAALLRGTRESLNQAFEKAEYYQTRVLAKILKAKNRTNG